MQQLSLLETPRAQPDDTVWTTLDNEQRTLVLGMLARLIARVIAARSTVTIAADAEASHD